MDQRISEFYNSLSVAEKEAHTLAAKMLGSSYVVVKTHAFLRWLKKMEQLKDQK